MASSRDTKDSASSSSVIISPSTDAPASSKENVAESSQAVLLVECGISVDPAIKKLYKQYGNSMLIMKHNYIDSIKDQIKEMTSLIEKKINIFCVILGDNYSDIKQDILDLIPMTTKLIWYITESNTRDTIKFLDKSDVKGLIIFDDLMRVVKVYD